MPHFKNSNNDLFWLDDEHDASIWLPECIRITDEEADSIRAEKKEALMNIMTYADKRSAEYPSFADQFDLLYHGGYDAWKTVINAIKTKYPKPE